MKLSIITINYNNYEGLKKTIDSVIAQSFTDYEWIVIDGGSTDGSKELIVQHAEKFSFWCSEPDKGIYNAMNKGIDKAQGEYIQFLNSGDCLYSYNILDKVFSMDYDADLLYGDYHLAGYNYTKHFPDKLSLSFFIDNCLNHQASFYRKVLFDSFRYDENYKIVSDWIYYFQLIFQNKKFHHLPHVIVDFQPNGIGSIESQEHLLERQNAIKQYVPSCILSDFDILKKGAYINQRKTYQIIMNFSYMICEKLEPLLIFLRKKVINKLQYKK